MNADPHVLRASRTGMPVLNVQRVSNGYILENWSGYAPSARKVFEGRLAVASELAESGEWFVVDEPGRSPEVSYKSGDPGLVYSLLLYYETGSPLPELSWVPGVVGAPADMPIVKEAQ
jgi:hypothetical protein